jgi:hypothetical protein
MCEFASFVLTKDAEFWCSDGDSHERIIAAHNLGSLDADRLNLVRVEITPGPPETVRDLSTWTFRVDQNIWPEWTYRGDPGLESRARRALARRAELELWFADLRAENGIASGGYAATVTGGYAATVTGGDEATVTGGDEATVTGGDRAILAVKWWDGARYRLAIGYVGEDGIEPGVPYHCADGRLVRAEVTP